MNVLVVAAHPDDEILGVGGTIRRHTMAGDEVQVMIVCEGISMRYGDDHRLRLNAQAERAAEILGVARLTFADLPDQRLDTVAMVDVIAKVEEVVNAFRPQTVYTHFGGDVNRDHQILFQAVQVAVRPYAAPWVREILAFETPSSTEWATPGLQSAFLPEVFVDISSTLDAKISAFFCYEREVRPVPHPRSPESLRAKAQTWGSVVGVSAAEPFQVIRAIR